MHRHLLFLVAITCCLTLKAGATIINVPGGVGTIQGAINVAASGDTVLIAPGTYFENISFRGKSITVASRYLTTANAEFIRTTVIDGSLPNHPDSGSVVVFSGGEQAGAILYGLTLTNGLGTVVPGSYAGGGILISQNSKPTVMYNMLIGNSAIRGGGIAVRNSNPSISRNVFDDNSAQNGGGLACENVNLLCAHNVFYDNAATANGGALYASGSTIQFEENVICGNHAAQGGGIYCTTSTCLPQYCDFNSNTNLNLTGFAAAGFGDTTWGVNFNKHRVDQYGNLFRAPDFADAAGLNFAPGCASPLIDAGAELPAKFPIGGKRTDLGAFEILYFPGDLNGDRKIGLTDITMLVNVIFVVTPLPCPYYVGDLDCSRRINMSDLITMIAYWNGLIGPPCSLRAN
ncbi:MAG: hypothetical protein ABIJ61_06345 [bacterium]